MFDPDIYSLREEVTISITSFVVLHGSKWSPQFCVVCCKSLIGLLFLYELSKLDF